MSNYLLVLFLSQHFYFRQDSIPDFCTQAVIFLPFSHQRTRQSRSSIGWLSITSDGVTSAIRIIRALPPSTT